MYVCINVVRIIFCLLNAVMTIHDNYRRSSRYTTSQHFFCDQVHEKIEYFILFRTAVRSESEFVTLLPPCITGEPASSIIICCSVACWQYIALRSTLLLQTTTTIDTINTTINTTYCEAAGGEGRG